MKQHLFRNFYKCPCGEEWEDVWSATCDDRCPSVTLPAHRIYRKMQTTNN